MTKVRITEYLDIDLSNEKWCCNRCNAELNSARESYMKGCLLYERPAAEIYGEGKRVSENEVVSYSPDPNFLSVIEFYCPSCGIMVEVQYLPPGHPIEPDIELNIDRLKEKHAGRR
ncbi:MAG: acetophenone carboxylase [Desulfobacteraceae bacterium]|nr:acetophenone carboxylase [Desulfobacteraceae bacterium]